MNNCFNPNIALKSRLEFLTAQSNLDKQYIENSKKVYPLKPTADVLERGDIILNKLDELISNTQKQQINEKVITISKEIPSFIKKTREEALTEKNRRVRLKRPSKRKPLFTEDDEKEVGDFLGELRQNVLDRQNRDISLNLERTPDQIRRIGEEGKSDLLKELEEKTKPRRDLGGGVPSKGVKKLSASLPKGVRDRLKVNKVKTRVVNFPKIDLKKVDRKAAKKIGNNNYLLG